MISKGTINANTVQFTGVTSAVHDITLSMPVTGSIDNILFKEGDWVQKGQPILHLERQSEQLEAQLYKLIWENTTQLEAFKIQEKKLESIFNATKRLFEKNKVVSQDELTRTELEYLRAHFKKIELEKLEQQEQIQYNLASVKLKRMSLYAPITGIITQINLDKGEQCRPNMPMVHLVDPRRCYFICNIEEHFARSLSLNQKIKILIQAGTKKIEKTGKVIFISPVVEPASNLMMVKLEFNNHDRAVNPGVSGTIVLPVSEMQ